jgi:hypothetical protein
MERLHEAARVWDALVTPTMLVAAAGAAWLVLGGVI